MATVENKEWYVRSEDGKVYGPANVESLVRWACEGRIEPAGFVSRDRISWTPAQTLPELQMDWLVEVEPGKVFGPYNRAYVSKLAAAGAVPKSSKLYRAHPYGIDQDPPPVEKVVEKIVEKRVEVPVEVEKIVEKIVEKRVEVPVEVEKIVERVIEVEPPARKAIVAPEVLDPVAVEPPARTPGNIFKSVDRNSLAALEAAARRELSAAAAQHRGGFGGLFGRKH